MRRGPRSALSEAQLHNRRDQFVQIFEGEWAEIGLELQTCKKADDLIRIFTPLAESRSWISQVVALLCRPCSEPCSAAILRKTRSERRRLAEPLRRADEAKQLAQEQLHQVDAALTKAHGRSRRIVKRARKQRRKEAWKTAQEYRGLANTERILEARIKGLEASFVRQELVRFIKSKRYEVTPVNLANAVAGLPDTGWRQSMRRNLRAPSRIANGLRYQVFKAIRYLTGIVTRKSENAFVRDFRQCIPIIPSRYGQPRNELAATWYYLERALRRSYRLKPRRKSLPFEIGKRYFKQIHSQSQVDIVLAQQARIILPKPKTPVSES
jgi:hypothetical protein